MRSGQQKLRADMSVDYWVICEISGVKYKRSDCVKNWKGQLVEVDVDAEVGMGWLFNGSVFSKRTPTLEDIDNLKASIRSSRNALLSATDWTQVADAPVDQTAWATYRQALRDITIRANFPDLAEADWPVGP